MKKLVFIFIALMFFVPQMEAQNSAQGYFRKIANEKKKVDKKRLKHFQMALKGDNPKKEEKYRTMVVDQVVSSMNTIKKLPPYKGDSAFRNDYVRVLNLYKEAYTRSYGDIQELKDSSQTSYDNMMLYLDAVEEMEYTIEEATEKLKRNEEYFSNKYNFPLRIDEEMEEQYEELNYVLYYLRDSYRNYYKVEFELKKIKNLDIADFVVKQERKHQMVTVKAIEKTISETVVLGDYEGDDSYQKDLIGLLEDVESMMREDYTEILDLAEDGSYDERKWDKGMSKFESFKEDLTSIMQNYYEIKAGFVEGYLPEDFEE